MAAIAASGEDAITTTIDVELDTTASTQNFEDFYEIDRSAKEIENGDYRRVAMQFPDSLLHDSVPIFRALKQKLGTHRELYVLADTSYGRQAAYTKSQVAASHVEADAVVHYGYACMSHPPRLPVIYVFGKKPIDVDDCVSQLQKVLQSDQEGQGHPRTVILRHDVVYTHKAALILDRLSEALASHQFQIHYVSVPNKVIPSSSRSQANVNPSPSSSSLTIHAPVLHPTAAESSNSCILYIGEESLGLTHLLMTHSGYTTISYSPSTRSAKLESASANTNKLLMRRYAMIQKARDADVFGILVGTLGGASYLPLIKYLRATLKKAHKKFYTISVGKLTPSKLANFMEIECFVLVACPENSLVDAKDFFRPIITPYELQVALADDPAEAWLSSSFSSPSSTSVIGNVMAGGGYVLDFQRLLIGQEGGGNGENTVNGGIGADSDINGRGKQAEEGVSERGGDEVEENDADIDRPIFSLVTGTYRHPRRFGASSEPSSSTESTLNGEVTGKGKEIARTQDGTLARVNENAAGTYLQESRTYQGLDPRFGQDAPSVLEQGRSGIARGYGEA
ncbi:hypothetical protein D9758_004492 [Tetrapyrgos nigripes]|uniref:2-(3-amino-3-carboxypropyl)histidine synthase subunit 2 n=1 Tax=Tetrapyrgos nigripes TaxID=182062 RepID=A0A8H5GN18_9AGAR|nr:hypothetical protein D9758_004492 [Tetrapyrgos nigripes]